jgi:3-oxoacyl-[acyl-carrier-protein] synthase-1
MVSSLGMDVANACAAARAEITRPSELNCMNFQGAREFGRDPSVFTGHVCGIGTGFTGKARLALLGSGALRDLVTRTGLTGQELLSCGFHLNMSDHFIEQAYQAKLETGTVPERFVYPDKNWKNEATQVLNLILSRSAVEIDPTERVLYCGGHTGFALAVEDARVKVRSGRIARCIVGAVDSCIGPRYLQAAASVRMLKTNDNPVGFSPGEGAAFVLVEKAGTGRRGAVSEIISVGVAEDASHQFTEEPATGRGFASAVNNALSGGAPLAKPSFVVADLNGTERRAMDWGHTIVRLQHKFAVGDLPLWLPAVSFGETGAAAGAISMCVALRGFERGYAPGGRALVTLASDSSTRASVIIEHAVT